jgi:membrane-associated phospholipid phosphatase
MFLLFYRILRTLRRIFTGNNLLWFIAAVALSLIAVYSGFDWQWFSLTRNTPLYDLTWPGVIIGSFVPIFGVLIYLAIAAIARNREHIRNAWALGQAALLGFVISTALKAFTGRIPPPQALVQGALDSSHGFQFGWLHGGVFWGWPSSHTTVAFAMAAALIALYPHLQGEQRGRKAARWIACVYALYIGVGVSISIHWFSEFAAGACIGWVIGRTVGKSFKEQEIG